MGLLLLIGGLYTIKVKTLKMDKHTVKKFAQITRFVTLSIKNKIKGCFAILYMH
jgi:hypothetical protein